MSVRRVPTNKRNPPACPIKRITIDYKSFPFNVSTETDLLNSSRAFMGHKMSKQFNSMDV